MKKEKWLIWKPLEGIPKKLCLEELKDNREGLTICLRENINSAILIVNFENYFSYRVTDEGDLLKTLHEKTKRADLETNIRNSTDFLVRGF